MHKSATKCNETLGKWCKNKHGASKIMDTLETYHWPAAHAAVNRPSRGRYASAQPGSRTAGPAGDGGRLAQPGLGCAGPAGERSEAGAGGNRPSQVELSPGPAGWSYPGPALAGAAMHRSGLLYPSPARDILARAFICRPRGTIIRPGHYITRPALQYAGPACCNLAF
jgi:hypothetical protein